MQTVPQSSIPIPFFVLSLCQVLCTSPCSSIKLKVKRSFQATEQYCLPLYLLQVKSDAVGFGFVVRGSSPVYVQAIDPKGPAAAAGLKV